MASETAREAPITGESSSDRISVELSSRRTGMSFQRTRMSADRTLMSVIRTSLSLIGFGFTIYQVFEKLHDAQVLKSSGAPRRFGEAVVWLGIAMLVIGIAYHVAFMMGLRREREVMKRLGLVHAESHFPVSLTLLTAIVLLAIGVVAILSMVTALAPSEGKPRRWTFLSAGCRLPSIVLVAGLMSAAAVFAEGLRDRFTDPDDGQLDASSYLLDHRRALAVPIVITERAVGYGGGLALAWFSETLRDAAARTQPSGRITPPDIYGAAFFATDNGTTSGGAGARLSFAEDRWRLRGALGVMDAPRGRGPRLWRQDVLSRCRLRRVQGRGVPVSSRSSFRVDDGHRRARRQEKSAFYIRVGNAWR